MIQTVSQGIISALVLFYVLLIVWIILALIIPELVHYSPIAIIIIFIIVLISQPMAVLALLVFFIVFFLAMGLFLLPLGALGQLFRRGGCM